MKIQKLYLIFLLALCNHINAQKNSLIINPNIVLPADSVASTKLITTLNSFLTAAYDNSQNEWTLNTENVETQVLVDEIQNIQKSGTYQNDSFYKSYLTKITPLENGDYAIHLANIGIHEDIALLRANFQLIANKTNEGYLISSPLTRNTKNWKKKKINNHTFHYPYTLNLEKAKEFSEYTAFYDKKLNNNDGESHFYLCTNEIDPLQVFGVEYKSDYNGWKLNNSWASSINKKNIVVLNESNLYNFDPHDLWHNRLNQVISRKKVHPRVNCHIACLHGGSWGLSWIELFTQFSEKFVIDKSIDWLEHKTNGSNFLTNGHKNYTDDFIGALLVKKIEKEKGFDGVWLLLLSKRTVEDESYFTTLEALVGISKQNYNKEVHKLIEEEMKRLEI